MDSSRRRSVSLLASSGDLNNPNLSHPPFYILPFCSFSLHHHFSSLFNSGFGFTTSSEAVRSDSYVLIQDFDQSFFFFFPKHRRIIFSDKRKARFMPSQSFFPSCTSSSSSSSVLLLLCARCLSCTLTAISH